MQTQSQMSAGPRPVPELADALHRTWADAKGRTCVRLGCIKHVNPLKTLSLEQTVYLNRRAFLPPSASLTAYTWDLDTLSLFARNCETSFLFQHRECASLACKIIHGVSKHFCSSTRGPLRAASPSSPSSLSAQPLLVVSADVEHVGD